LPEDKKELSRRRFVKAALATAGGAALFAAGEIVGTRSGTDAPASTTTTRGTTTTTAPHSETLAPVTTDRPKYKSRPDLDPPAVTVGTLDGQTSPGLIFVSPFGLMITDNAGEVIWFMPNPPAPANPSLIRFQRLNLSVQEFKGEPVLTWWEGMIGGRATCVIADTSYRPIRRVRTSTGYQPDMHEFQLTSRGTALFIAYSPVAANLASAGGPRDGAVLEGIVQEVDIDTGKVVFEWHGRDHIGFDESYQPPPLTPNVAFDYLHLNSIDDGGDSLIVSGRNTWTVYKIDRSSGDIVWRVGGKKSDFAMGPSATFAFQHDARQHADGTLSIFDDGSAPTVEYESRGIILSLDTDKMTANLVRQYALPQQTITGQEGNVQMLPDGHVFIGWGGAPYATEFSADASILFEATYGSGAYSYRAFRFPWSAWPASDPDIYLEKSGAQRTTVYTSWNGATDVAFWEVLAGKSRAAFDVVATASPTGFETAIEVASGAPSLAVRALDSARVPRATSAFHPRPL
jgi:hypothetical protein